MNSTLTLLSLTTRKSYVSVHIQRSCPDNAHLIHFRDGKSPALV